MNKKKPKPDPRNVVLPIPLSPQKRRRVAAPTAVRRRGFSDVPLVQQMLFDKGGAE